MYVRMYMCNMGSSKLKKIMLMMAVLVGPGPAIASLTYKYS